MSTLVAMVALVAILMFHEAGHYLGARLAGLRVLEVAFGWGRRLWSVRRGETRFAINALPLLAYVAVDMGEPGTADPRTVRNCPVAGRILYIAAGPAANLLLAAALVVGLSVAQGLPRAEVIVAGVTSGSPAQAAGLRVGDRLAAVAGRPVRSGAEVSRALAGKAAMAVRVDVVRAGRPVALRVVPHADAVGTPRIGIVTQPVHGGGSLGARVAAGGRQFGAMAGEIGRAYFLLLTGRLGMGGFSGPVSMVRDTARTAESGWASLVGIAVMVSINLGLLNLLPLPALDGSRLILLLSEALFRRKLREEQEAWIHAVGLAALLLFMLAVTVKDLVHLVA